MHTGEAGIEFRILGPLSVNNSIEEITPSAPKMRQVLAFFLVRSCKFIQVSEFIEELWGENPPNSAMTTLQTYIYKLRKDVVDRWPAAQLHTKVSGYLLDVPAECGDLSVFEGLTAEGAAALDSGDPRRATRVLTEALELWRGSALADVSAGGILSAYATRLEEDRLRALELRIQADLQLGRHLELISELKALTARQPLHEKLYGYLMLALHRSGRRHEALDVYRTLRQVLIDELGLEPSASLQELHHSLLTSEPSLDTATPVAKVVAVAPTADAEPAPAQFPPAPRDFTGRADEIQWVSRHLSPGRQDAASGRALVVTGMPGAGKTALALQAAHLASPEFSDGHIYSNLGAASGTPADPRQVLADLLQSIGIPQAQVPDSLEARIKLFRTLCTGRRILMVLDDAASTHQVAPLLPTAPGCALIITGRQGLYGLPGVRHLELDVLTAQESLRLLESIIGPSRIAAERPAAERIVQFCGQLPLALRAVGSCLAEGDAWPLSKMAEQLADPVRRLDALSCADLDIRASYHASYRSLDPSDRSAFRLISLLPPDFYTSTAAGLIGSSPDAVEAQLMRLVSSHLLGIAERGPDGEIQYSMHDLIRLYGRERLEMEFVKQPGGTQQQPRDDTWASKAKDGALPHS
jgi:DNA-binding SARP family transcriptional activator